MTVTEFKGRFAALPVQFDTQLSRVFKEWKMPCGHSLKLNPGELANLEALHGERGLETMVAGLDNSCICKISLP